MTQTKKTRIALVEAGTPSTHVYSKTYLPRTGLPTIGAILKGMGYKCDLWFQLMKGFREEKLAEYDLVGIGSLSGQIHEAYRIADSLRAKGITVVMGGPHVTFMPEEALEHCDYVVLGEGENIFTKLVESIEKNEDGHEVAGLAYKNGSGEACFSPGEVEPVDFAALPVPDFSLSPQVSPGETPPIISTSRGCPHNCNFCSVTAVFGRRYRFKSNEQVISELRPVLNRSVCFADDNFCANPSRTKSLLRDMIRQGAVPLRWSGEITVGAGQDTELLDLMKQTRCRIAYVGIESIIPETLKALGKSHEVEAIETCIENLHKRGIGIHGMFVLGIDDDPGVVEKIIDYSIEHDIDTMQLFALTPFPGTRAYEENKDRLLHTDWKYYTGMCVVFEPSRCSAYELQVSIVEGMKRFYSLKRVVNAYRPGRGWRVKYRAGANYIVRKWIRENASYIEWLRTLSST